MTFQHQQPVRGRRRRFRRLLARALAVSALLHAALLLLWRVEPAPPPGAGGSPGAAPSPSPPLDEAMRVMAVAPPTAEPETGAESGRPVAVRLPEAEARAVRDPVPTTSAMSLERVSGAAAGSPRLALADGGQGASASGEGAGSPGEPGRVSPPVPRSLLPQWDPPPEVRGSQVTVMVEVGRDGRPTGRVQLEPPTESEEFNRRLRETLTSVHYRPGTRAGQPVVAWAEITFVF